MFKKLTNFKRIQGEESVIGGVVGGLAYAFGFRAKITRYVFIGLLLMTCGFSVFKYVLAAIVYALIYKYTDAMVGLPLDYKK